MRATLPSTTRVIAVAAVSGLLVAGCSGEDIAERLVEEAAEQAGGGEVDIDTDDGSVNVETDEGSVNIGSQELPEDLPDELPLPEGIAVHGSMSQENDEGSTIGFQATYDGTFDDAEAFFDAELAAAGWTITNSTISDVSGLRSASWEIEGFGHAGLVSLTQLGDEGDEGTVTGLSVNLETTGGSGS